jgi:predicted CopG family antitoxin
MGTKTISIKTEVYEKLIALKAPGESFSDQLDRLSSKGSILDLAGAWNNMSEKEVKKIKEKITKGRESRSRLDEINLRF